MQQDAHQITSEVAGRLAPRHTTSPQGGFLPIWQPQQGGLTLIKRSGIQTTYLPFNVHTGFKVGLTSYVAAVIPLRIAPTNKTDSAEAVRFELGGLKKHKVWFGNLLLPSKIHSFCIGGNAEAS